MLMKKFGSLLMILALVMLAFVSYVSASPPVIVVDNGMIITEVVIDQNSDFGINYDMVSITPNYMEVGITQGDLIETPVSLIKFPALVVNSYQIESISIKEPPSFIDMINKKYLSENEITSRIVQVLKISTFMSTFLIG